MPPLIGDAVRFVTATVDERVVSPVAARLATSVANPYVLSALLWQSLKRMTPQRARDATRLLSTAVANALGVLQADDARALAASTRRLQDEAIAAAVTPQGRDVVINSVATAAKVAQALNTPETRAATRQALMTLQSVIDVLASPPGRRLLSTAGDCLDRLGEVLASPESAVLLAEVATNLCHAMEVEFLRREDAAAEAKAGDTAIASSTASQVPTGDVAEDEHKPLGSPMSSSSAAETSFETESEMSLPSSSRRPSLLDPTTSSAATATSPNGGRQRGEKRAGRSARIEKTVLLRMGVAPAMLDEIQRVLDRLREEEEARETPAIPEEDDDELMAGVTDIEDDDDSGDGDAFAIHSAFGVRSSTLPELSAVAEDEETKPSAVDDEPTDVILPDWHPDSVRTALRRRHVASAATTTERQAQEAPARAMTAVLADRRRRRQQAHPAAQDPLDLLAVRILSLMLTACMGVVLLLGVVYLAQSIFLRQ